MEDAPENSKESSHSAHTNGMNEWYGHSERLINYRGIQKQWTVVFGHESNLR
jgi:hypothetical protein